MDTTHFIKLFGHDDFENAIDELLLPAEIVEKRVDEKTSELAGREIFTGITFYNIPRTMSIVCDELGIGVKKTASFSYLRDRFLRLPNQTIALPIYSSLCQEAAKRVHSSNLYLNCAPACFTNNQIFNGWSGSTAQILPSQEEKDLFGTKIHSFADTYAEGGNVFCLTNAKGIVKVCIGKDHLLQTLLLHELNKASWEHLGAKVGKDFFALQETFFSSLTEEQIFAAIEEMYSLGLLTIEGKTGLISQEQQLELLMIKFYFEGKNTEKKTLFKDLVHSAKFCPKLNRSGYLITAFCKDAAEYLAKLEIVKALMAKDFCVQSENVHYIAQAGYHLDSFLVPGPNKKVFINSYKKVYEVLEVFKDSQEYSLLSQADKSMLDTYCETAKKLDRELCELLIKAKNDLEKAGFTVVAMPMHFVYEPLDLYKGFPVPSVQPNAFFGNAITGWSEKQNSLYYITLGTECGEALGNIFMNIFKKELLKLCVVKVFFIGNDPNNPQDYSEAVDFWGRLDLQSGIHCACLPSKLRVKNKIKS